MRRICARYAWDITAMMTTLRCCRAIRGMRFILGALKHGLIKTVYALYARKEWRFETRLSLLPELKLLLMIFCMI